MARSPRTLTVLIGTLPIEDGQTPPPVVGEVGRYWLLFVEAMHDEPDATVVTVQARAESVGDGSPQTGGLMWDGTVRDDPPHWSTMLHGNGWTASWLAPRPVVGQVVLRGTVVADLSGGQVRGRVARARVVSETFDRTDPDHPRIPALQRLREVDTGPRWFDHGRRRVRRAPDGSRPCRATPTCGRRVCSSISTSTTCRPCPCGPRSRPAPCRSTTAT